MSRDKGHEGKWQERSVTKLDAIDARVTHNHSNVTYFLCLCDTTMITILFSFPHVLPSRHLRPSLLLILNTIQLDAEDHHVAAMAVNHHQIRSFRPRHSPTGTSTPQWEVVSLLRVRSIFGLVARSCSPRWTVEEWTKGHGVRLRVAGFVAERCTHTGMATVFDRQCPTSRADCLWENASRPPQ